MTKEEFIKEVKKIGIELTDEQLNQFEIYANFLIEYNKHTNLTAITNMEDIYLKHFYDSITIIKSIDLINLKNVLDIGTGAGFPGMVIAILNKNINVTLLDSNNKKTTFLNELKNKLNVNNVEVVNTRAEEYVKIKRNSYDLVTSRAVANLYTLGEISIPLVKINGYFIALKGDIEEELKLSKTHIKDLGGVVENVISFKLPKEESIRNIIKIKKIKDNSKYPRIYGTIKKEYEHIVKSNQ